MLPEMDSTVNAKSESKLEVAPSSFTDHSHTVKEICTMACGRDSPIGSRTRRRLSRLLQNGPCSGLLLEKRTR